MLIVLQLTSCVKRVHQLPTLERQSRSRADFVNVIVNGDLDLVLTSRTRGSDASLVGFSTDLSHISTTVENQTLTITVPNHYRQHGKVKAVVGVTQLNGLHVNGNGSVMGRNIHSSAMDLTLTSNATLRLSGHLDIRHLNLSGNNDVRIDGVYSRLLDVKQSGTGKTKLTGVIALHELQVTGKSSLSMNWVKAKDLHITANEQASAELAGIAHVIHTHITDQAQLDGRYLRADEGYLEATDQSTIRTQVLATLNAQAEGQSRIYTYNRPKYKAEFMRQEGAILEMTPYR